MREKTKNTMRSPSEKERIVLEAYENGLSATSKKHSISRRLLQSWIKKYREQGIEGLKSQTGKHGNGLKGLHVKKSRTREEELELENLKLKVEVARLKKGYLAKGVGSKKEYVTIKDSNTKS